MVVRDRAGAVVAGQPVPVEVVADEGEHWFIDGQVDPDSRPVVTYTTVMLEDGTVLDSRPGGGGTFTVIFPRPGDYRMVASCSTTTVPPIVSRRVRVRAAGPPVFTVAAPADGDRVDLNEGGGTVDVRLAVPPDQFFPLTVDVIRDGATSSTR